MMSDSNGSKVQILVVDDEPDLLLYLSTLLGDHGFGVRTAEDGDEAMKSVRSKRPDLVSLDISMPKQSGVRFYKNLKSDPELKNIPVVIVTGITKAFERFIATRKQVPPPDGYIAKPFRSETYLDTVRGLVGNG
jgi:twitching motility two-component system response regulator PilH